MTTQNERSRAERIRALLERNKLSEDMSEWGFDNLERVSPAPIYAIGCVIILLCALCSAAVGIAIVISAFDSGPVTLPRIFGFCGLVALATCFYGVMGMMFGLLVQSIFLHLLRLPIRLRAWLARRELKRLVADPTPLSQGYRIAAFDPKLESLEREALELIEPAVLAASPRPVH